MIETINNLCHIISGGTPKTSILEYWNGSIPWISIKDFISVNRYISTTEKTITRLGLDNSTTNLLADNDIILSARGTVGEVAILEKPMAFNQSCYGIRTKNDEILNQLYLFYWFKAHIIDIQTGAHGAVFDTITRNDFDRLKINVPNIEEQRHIVNTILSHFFF
ncbi:restriction endonuclease subunit S [Metamycoplasma equirhinis]|uniref:restriction endonuclease subunit S n=1 Tax=Metamycoplasma equirhinis TaxID=92402 RepID=UPI00359341C0